MLGLSSTFLGRQNQPGYELGVSPGFLEALGAELLAGRMFTGSDEVGVAILSRRAVAVLLPGRSLDAVIGATVEGRDGAPRSVSGVVADMRARPGAAALPMLFEPHGARSAPALVSFVALRMEPGVAPDPAVLSARLSAEFGTNIPVRQVSHLPETLSPWLREPRRPVGHEMTASTYVLALPIVLAVKLCSARFPAACRARQSRGRASLRMHRRRRYQNRPDAACGAQQALLMSPERLPLKDPCTSR
jgi:hypothetical protein